MLQPAADRSIECIDFDREQAAGRFSTGAIQQRACLLASPQGVRGSGPAETGSRAWLAAGCILGGETPECQRLFVLGEFAGKRSQRLLQRLPLRSRVRVLRSQCRGRPIPPESLGVDGYTSTLVPRSSAIAIR